MSIQNSLVFPDNMFQIGKLKTSLSRFVWTQTKILCLCVCYKRDKQTRNYRIILYGAIVYGKRTVNVLRRHGGIEVEKYYGSLQNASVAAHSTIIFGTVRICDNNSAAVPSLFPVPGLWWAFIFMLGNIICVLATDGGVENEMVIPYTYKKVYQRCSCIIYPGLSRIVQLNAIEYTAARHTHNKNMPFTKV